MFQVTKIIFPVTCILRKVDSSHNPRQSTSSTSSQESTDFAEIDEERVRNWRLQRVVLASDSSSESGEGRVTKSRKTGPMREKQLG